jgi:hypothetical protein
MLSFTVTASCRHRRDQIIARVAINAHGDFAVAGKLQAAQSIDEVGRQHVRVEGFQFVCVVRRIHTGNLKPRRDPVKNSSAKMPPARRRACARPQ